MSQFTNLLLRRLVWAGVLANCLILVGALYGVFQLWSQLTNLERDVFPQQLLANRVVALNVELTREIQAWKNLIIRSANVEQANNLWKKVEFHKSEVQTLADSIKTAAINDADKKLYQDFLREFEKMNVGYKKAYQVFLDSNLNIAMADKTVLGIDRQAQQILDSLSENIMNRSVTKANNTIDIARTSMYIALVVTILGFCLSLFIFARFVKRLIMTPIKQMDEELGSARKALIQSERMASLGSLVAGVAHEVNTPVSIGLTCATTFQESVKSVREKFASGSLKKQELEKFLESSKECAELIEANAIRAADLVQSFKQIAVDQSNEEVREIRLKRYLEEILASLRPKWKHRPEIEVVATCSDDLVLVTVAGAFAQVVSNLVINSLVHAFDEGQGGAIRINASFDDSGRVLLSVWDNGKGIPPENLGKIFDPFFTTKRGKGGTGLGLNIVYNIVTEALHGSIEVRSEVGKGSEFAITLPTTIGNQKTAGV